MVETFGKHCLKKKIKNKIIFMFTCAFFTYKGFEIINNVQYLSVLYAVNFVKAIIFLSIQLHFWKLIYIFFSAGVKTLFW